MSDKRLIEKIAVQSMQLFRDCLITINPDGKIIYCNPAIELLTGYSDNELTGTDFFKAAFITDKSKELYKKSIENIKSGKGFDTLSAEFVKRSGEKLLIESRMGLLVSDGETLGIQILSRQIRPEKDIENFLTYQLELEKLLSSISYRFIGIEDEKIDDLIIESLGQVSSYFGAVKAIVFLLDFDSRSVINTHEWRKDPDDHLEALNQPLPVEKFLYSAGLLEQDKIAIYNQRDDVPKKATGEQEWFAEYGFRPLLLVPIRADKSLVGTLLFYGDEGIVSTWQDETAELLRVFGDIIWTAIHRRQTNRLLRLVQFTIDSYTQPILWLDSNNKIINCNPAACYVLGYDCEELCQMHAWDIDPGFPKDKSGDMFQHLKSVRRDVRESFHKKKNGELYPVELTAHYIEFEGQEMACVFSQDITDRKEAERVILESEQQYKRVFENIVDVFYEASMDGILLNVSPSVEDYLKYKRDDIIGSPMPTFYADVKDREVLLKELNKKGFVKGYEIRIKDKDGEIKEAILSSKIITNENGEPDRIVGSILDTSELKKAEKQIKQLSSAIEQSPLVVIFTDIEGTVEYVNQMFYSTSGQTPDAVIGKNITTIPPGNISRGKINDILGSVSKGESWQGELEYSQEDKGKLWYQLSVSAIHDDSGNPSHAIYIIQDITSRKEFEENLRVAKQRAEQADHLKSSFLANMSHEIRTPMNAILGFASLLKEETLTPDQTKYYIDIINTKGRDLLRIISDIIDISRIEAGDLLIKMEPVEVYRFIQEIHSEYKEDSALSSKPNLSFRINIPEKKRKVILNTDPARLKQVIVNLIQNALKFTTEGFIEVGFSFKGRNTIMFYVRDTGIGIPAEKQKIIFDRFRQVDDTHTREYGGTGLGLTISRNLVEKLGGKLKVESKENLGSTFFFELKYIPTDLNKDLDDEWTEEIKDKVVAGPAGKSLDLKGKRILVAEDDGSSFIFLETILKKYNAEIVWVKDGKQVIEHLKKENNIDMILMDIRMPDMDGIVTTKKIRESNNPVPIIAQTAYAQLSDKKLALDSGCDDYIAKPIKVGDLTALLEKYLG